MHLKKTREVMDRNMVYNPQDIKKNTRKPYENVSPNAELKIVNIKTLILIIVEFDDILLRQCNAVYSQNRIER